MRGISVREAKPDDLDAVVELRLSLLREYGDHPLYGRLHPDVRRRAFELYRTQLASTSETMFVAVRDGDIVGVLRCVDAPSSPLLMPEHYCYVSSAYVKPDLRRTGVLSALVDAAERWCDARGITEMRLHNASGVRMPNGQIYKNSMGLDATVIAQTLKEVANCRRSGIMINTFMLARDRTLVEFVKRVSEISRGKAYFTSTMTLGQFILMDFLKRKTRKVS